MRNVLLVLVLATLCGCGPGKPSGPKYNEALETYVNEMSVAERLISERDGLPKDDARLAKFDANVEAQLKRVDAAKRIVDELRDSK